MNKILDLNKENLLEGSLTPFLKNTNIINLYYTARAHLPFLNALGLFLTYYFLYIWRIPFYFLG